MTKDGQQETLLVFTDKDAVKGEVTLKVDTGKRLEHIGVKVEFIGQIEMFYGNLHEFIAMVRDLDAPGGRFCTISCVGGERPLCLTGL